MSKSEEAHSIHHINFPVADLDRAADWYKKVFGMKRIDVTQWTPQTMETTLLMTKGSFDLHFTKVEKVPVDSPHHFAVEVEEWEPFLAHLDELGISYLPPYERPNNNSKTSEIRDPDGNLVEIVWHGDRDW